MADYITTREYADLHGLSIETVRTWTKVKKIAFIKVGNSILIDRNTPIPGKMKKRTKAEIAAAESKVDSLKSKYKVVIRKAYYVAIEDSSGKEITSDFTFLNKAEAEKLGAKMKREIEARG